MAEEEREFDPEKAMTELYIEMVKGANGFTYYESKVTSDGEGNVLSVDVYEKRSKPRPKMAKLLDGQGIKWKFHPAK